MKRFLKENPIFVILVIIFFVLHAYTSYYRLIPISTAGSLIYRDILFAITITACFYLLFRNLKKASIFTFILFAFNYFFSPVHELLSKLPVGLNVLSKYGVIIPLAFTALIVIYYLLKKTSRDLKTFTAYLNTLFLVLIFIEITTFGIRFATGSRPGKFNLQPEQVCTGCPRPDIYLIIADEYAGDQQLKEALHFDNSAFYAALKIRGFHVVENSRSNYNFTHHSVASLLDMNLLAGLDLAAPGYSDMAGPLTVIRHNQATKYLADKGYALYNYSLFDIAGKPSPASPTFLPLNKSWISSRTFLSKMKKDLEHHFISWGISRESNSRYYADRNNNELFFKRTKEAASSKSSQPKFVYSHFVMPHYRYYYSADGKEIPFEKVKDDDFCKNHSAYTGYLQYTNNRLLELVDHIIRNSQTAPVILLMSDHGYRQYFQGDKAFEKPAYFFMNLNAVYLPGKEYKSFYPGLSNVNQFRTLFNVLFKEKFPVLNDSLNYVPH